jgi:quercetin dioxygenase-like cupin family protein
MKRRLAKRGGPLFLGGMGVCISVVALATPGSGVVSNVVSRATAPEAFNIKFKNRDADFEVRVQAKGPSDFITQTVAFAPGGTSGWHSHSGPAFVSVKSGTATFYEADDPSCSPVVVPVGTVFIEQGEDVHIARNEGTTDLVLNVLYITPVGAPQRVDQPAPGNCPF